MKNLKTFNEFVNESKNKFKIEDFENGTLIELKNGEVWKVVNKGKKKIVSGRGYASGLTNDNIQIKPYNDIAKDKNISLPNDVDLEWLNANVLKIK